MRNSGFSAGVFLRTPWARVMQHSRPWAGCCGLQTIAQARAGRCKICRRLARLDSAVFTWQLLHPDALQPCRHSALPGSAECFPAELHCAGLCAAGTGQPVATVAGRHSCGSEQVRHANPRLQSSTVSVGELDPLKKQGMDRGALCITALHQPALPCASTSAAPAPLHTLCRQKPTCATLCTASSRESRSSPVST